MSRLECEYCDVPEKPAVFAFNGTWTASTAGPIPVCQEHAQYLVADLIEHFAVSPKPDDLGDAVLLSFQLDDLGDGDLLSFQLSVLGTEEGS